MSSILRAIVAACALLASTGIEAQTYPARSVRFVVGFPPGGSNDIVTRLLAQKLTETMGQTFVVDNRGGANAISKKNPWQLNYASGGTGATVHLSGELFQHLTGVKVIAAARIKGE